MRFLVDIPLSPALAAWLNAKGHDAVHASAIGLSRAPDTEILERGLKENRVLITADLDFARLLAQAGAAGPGLILFRGGSYNEQQCRQRLEKVFELIAEPELPQTIVVVEKGRIRRRTLPIEPKT